MSSDKLAPRSLSRISRPSSDAPQPVSFAVSGSAQWRSPADQAQPAGRRSTPAARRCHRADAESVAREVSIREEHAPLRGSGRLFHERSQLPGSPPRYAQGSCCGCPGGGPGRYCATSGLAASTKKTISVEISSHILPPQRFPLYSAWRAETSQRVYPAPAQRIHRVTRSYVIR